MKPKLSIIIPMYNDSEGFIQTIESLQKSIDWSNELVQIIVIDSSINHQTSHYQNITWIYLPKKTYAGHARNIGVEVALSDWIGFLDCGLEVELEWINLMIQSQSLGVEVIWGKSDFLFISPKDRAYVRSFHRVSFSRRFIRSSMIKKSLFLSMNGFVTHVHAGEDLDFYKRVSKLQIREEYNNAQAWYAHYPRNSLEILKKWSSFTKDNVIVNQAHRKFVFVLFELFALGILIISILNGYLIVLVFAFQLAMIRLYWQTKQSSYPLVSIEDTLLTLWYTMVFDLSRIVGVIWGIFEKVKIRHET
ncbi:MAG: glycosyltransferase [Erysipelothrix sp.]|jgi:glycosyltransferase involved in cell wall biosynthesis|nr:glycosyltransferase [Erysipelothrix sp.]